MGAVSTVIKMKTMTLNVLMKEWFEDSYWHWRNVFYFRFNEYNDEIDRGAFFEELNYGWMQMYQPEMFV